MGSSQHQSAAAMGYPPCQMVRSPPNHRWIIPLSDWLSNKQILWYTRVLQLGHDMAISQKISQK